MSREEELKKELAQIEAEKQKRQEPKEDVAATTTEEVDPKLLELQLKQFLRLLKDKQKQISGNFRKSIMEIDTTRKDQSKTVNQIRNEVDEIEFNIAAIKRILPNSKVDEIESAISKEKDE